MDTTEGSDHTIDDEQLEFIQDAIDYWLIYKLGKTPKDFEHYHHITNIINKLRISPFLHTLNYKRTKDQ